MKNAIVVLLNNYADWEAGYLTGILKQKDWQIKYASNQQIVHSIGGMNVQVDYQLSDLASLDEFDLLVLIGGQSWSLEDNDLHNLIDKQLKSKRALGAICGAVDYLARNGFLNHYQHTGNAQYIWKNYANYQNEGGFLKKQAVLDKNLVTANGTAALDFTRLVLELIGDTPINAQKAVDLYRLGFYNYCGKYGNPF